MVPLILRRSGIFFVLVTPEPWTSPVAEACTPPGAVEAMIWKGCYREARSRKICNPPLGSTPATGWSHPFSLHAVFQAGRHGVHAVDQEPDGWQISIGNFQDQSKWRSRHDGPSPQSTRLKLPCGACPCAPQRLSAAVRHLHRRPCPAGSHRCRGCMAPRPQRRPASRRCRDRCRRRDGPFFRRLPSCPLTVAILRLHSPLGT
jgi:hypothetical protein